MKIGANYLGDNKCEFTLWAPFKNEVALKLISPQEQVMPMKKNQHGYWSILVENLPAGAQYFYLLDGIKERPDPASFYQRQGVHGPSEVVDHSCFPWDDTGFQGIPLEEMIIYELHVGTFTPKGTFYDIIPKIKELIRLGINVLELMPVAQFPGQRNWGYDGVYPYAVQNSYGGPDGLKELVNEAHVHGRAVILDVVYNHLGPEGNYFLDFGPYFTDKYSTAWGMAINYDDAYSPAVRNFFIQNALYWFENFHIDGLRLDAVHGIYDLSAKHILEDLAETAEKFSQRKKRKYYLIAESDLNDVRIIQPRDCGGYGINAQWLDDFHHCLHTILTKENSGYYLDFGRTEQIVKAMQEGFVYQGQYSVYRRRNHGNSSINIPAKQFVVFAQNHDQVGNRAQGERLSKLVNFEALKLAAGVVILSVYTPLLFMGEEYAEDVPFLYFVSHSDKDLIEAVRNGRREEFAAFSWSGVVPDPQDEQTFISSKISWEKRKQGHYNVMFNFYQKLIEIRKKFPAFIHRDKKSMRISAADNQSIIFYRRWYNRNELFSVMNFNNKDVSFSPRLSEGKWKKIIDSSDKVWNGPGSLLPEYITDIQQLETRATSFALYEKEVLR